MNDQWRKEVIELAHQVGRTAEKPPTVIPDLQVWLNWQAEQELKILTR